MGPRRPGRGAPSARIAIPDRNREVEPPDLARSRTAKTRTRRRGSSTPSRHGARRREREDGDLRSDESRPRRRERGKTGIFDPASHGLDDENEKTGIFDPTKHGLADENDERRGSTTSSRHELGAATSAPACARTHAPSRPNAAARDPSAPRMPESALCRVNPSSFKSTPTRLLRRPSGASIAGWPGSRRIRLSAPFASRSSPVRSPSFGGSVSRLADRKPHGPRVTTRGAPASTQPAPSAAPRPVEAPVPEEPHGVNPASLPPRGARRRRNRARSPRRRPFARRPRKRRNEFRNPQRPHPPPPAAEPPPTTSVVAVLSRPRSNRVERRNEGSAAKPALAAPPSPSPPSVAESRAPPAPKPEKHPRPPQSPRRTALNPTPSTRTASGASSPSVCSVHFTARGRSSPAEGGRGSGRAASRGGQGPP